MYLSDGGVHFLRFALPPKNLKNTLDAALKVIAQTFMERFNPLEIKKIVNQYVASKVYEKNQSNP
jgi:hypothetical protein